MSERDFPDRIREHLDRGLQQIDADRLAQLQAARERALLMQRQPATMPILAGAESFLRARLDGFRLQHLLLLAALLLTALLFTQWQDERAVTDLSEIDSALLADEMPVEAFTDHGFESWLTNSR